MTSLTPLKPVTCLSYLSLFPSTTTEEISSSHLTMCILPSEEFHFPLPSLR